MPLDRIGGAGAPEPATWQTIPTNGPGISVTYPRSEDPQALPQVAILVPTLPGRQGPQPVRITTSGTDMDSFCVQVTDSAGGTRAAHAFGVDLVQDVIRNELARPDLSDVQRDQLSNLLTAAMYLRGRTQLREDPEGGQNAEAFHRYADASAVAAQQGRSISVLEFFTP